MLSTGCIPLNLLITLIICYVDLWYNTKASFLFQWQYSCFYDLVILTFDLQISGDVGVAK